MHTKPTINSITIENYRSLGYLHLKLSPLTVLLGYNAAGKSNVVEALSYLRDILHLGVERASQQAGRESFNDILYRGATEPIIRFAINLDMLTVSPNQTQALSYNLAVGPDPRNGYLQVREEYLGEEKQNSSTPSLPFVHLKANHYHLLNQAGSTPQVEQAEFNRTKPALAQLTERRKYSLAQQVYQRLINIANFQFNPAQIRLEAQLVSKPQLGKQGQDLAAVLDNLPRQTITAILSELREVVPPIEDIILKTGKPGHKLITLLEKGQEKPFYPHQISDGTLRFLALLAVAHGAVDGPLVIIEEPENGIHPTQLFQIVALLRGQANCSQVNQKFIITTHAHSLVSCLKPEELRLLSRHTESGETTDITPPPTEIKKRLDTFEGILGDLWFSGGLE